MPGGISLHTIKNIWRNTSRSFVPTLPAGTHQRPVMTAGNAYIRLKTVLFFAVSPYIFRRKAFRFRRRNYFLLLHLVKNCPDLLIQVVRRRDDREKVASRCPYFSTNAVCCRSDRFFRPDSGDDLNTSLPRNGRNRQRTLSVSLQNEMLYAGGRDDYYILSD